MKIFIVLYLLAISDTVFAKFVTYPVMGQSYEGFVVNKGKDAPLVFVIHDWDGLTEYEVKRSEMLAQQGYSVFAIDLFGKGLRPTEEKYKRQHTGELYKDRQKMRKLLSGAYEEAAKLGLNVKNSVVAGYCFGGAAVLEWARSGAPLKGFVTFHGGLQTPEGQDYQQTKGELLVFHGSADQAITMTEFANLARQLEQARVPHEMTSFGGAPHAFTVFGSPNYRADADKKSWTRFLSFLKQILKRT